MAIVTYPFKENYSEGLPIFSVAGNTDGTSDDYIQESDQVVYNFDFLNDLVAGDVLAIRVVFGKDNPTFFDMKGATSLYSYYTGFRFNGSVGDTKVYELLYCGKQSNGSYRFTYKFDANHKFSSASSDDWFTVDTTFEIGRVQGWFQSLKICPAYCSIEIYKKSS